MIVTLLGYKIVEDNEVKELRLPKEVIEFLKEPYVCGSEWVVKDE
jgi:hypothetical protein